MALTKVTGSVIKDSVSLSGNVSVGGTLTYQDVTNVDALGIGTFRTGIKVLGGGINAVGVVTATSFVGNIGGTPTFSGDITIPDKIIHTGDTNTAIRFPAADTFSVETGGSERIRITSGGDLYMHGNAPTHTTSSGSIFVSPPSGNPSRGILWSNTSDTHYVKLEPAVIDGLVINGYSGVAFATGSRSNSTWTERLRMDSAGRVGLGTIAPSSFHANADNFVIMGDNAHVGMTLMTTNGGLDSTISFADGTSGGTELQGAVIYQHNGDIMRFLVNQSEKLRITSQGAIGLGGATYGSSGQVLTSGGASGGATWSTVSGTTINNNANNRIITGSGTANTLEGESTVTFDGTQFRVNAGNTSNLQVDGLYCYAKIGGVKLWRGAGNLNHNTGLGHDTLNNASGGQDCTAVGHNALNNSTTGSANTVVGSHAMVGTVTGNNNVAVGHGALNKNTSGYNNTAVGRLAGLELLGGHNNTFLGLEAGTNNTSGSNNIYGGSGAGKYESTSTDNVAIGWNCFGAERSGGNSNQFNKNVCIGHQALAQQRIANGDGENVCIGYRAMYNVTTSGWRNCIIGYQAGHTQNGASYNTFLGTFAGYNYTSGGNTMCLGYNAGTANSPSGALTANQDTICLGNDAISNLYCNDTSISSSDARDKTDVTEWTHGLSFINQLKPVTYRWDKRTWYGTDEEPIGTPDGSKKRARLHLGFLAQDALAVEKSFGYASKKDDMLAVNLNEDGSAYGMKYERLVVPLTKAVQELSEEVDQLKAEIASLKSS